jgi:hypothetical protein
MELNLEFQLSWLLMLFWVALILQVKCLSSFSTMSNLSTDSLLGVIDTTGEMLVWLFEHVYPVYRYSSGFHWYYRWNVCLAFLTCLACLQILFWVSLILQVKCLYGSLSMSIPSSLSTDTFLGGIDTTGEMFVKLVYPV